MDRNFAKGAKNVGLSGSGATVAIGWTSCSLFIIDADEVEAVGGGGHASFAAVEGGEDAVEFVFRGFASADFDEGSHDAADHVVEEAVADDVERDVRAFLFGKRSGEGAWLMPHGPAGVFLDGDFEEGADAGELIGPVTFKATEVVRAEEGLGGDVHGFDIEEEVAVPGIFFQEGERGGVVVDEVAVAFLFRLEAGMKTEGDIGDFEDGDVVG